MDTIYNPDIPLFRVVYKLVQLVLLGVLWMLCCIPVITAGPATTALYYAVAKGIRHDEDSVWSAFFGAFRSNFRRGALVTVLLAVCLGIVGFGTYTAYAPQFAMAVPGILCWLVSYPMEKIFRRYMPKPAPGEPVPWYWL